MRKGIVLSYNKDVKYGFIKDLNGQRIRFYNDDNSIILNVGNLVQFAIGIIKNRPCAVNILILCRNHSRVDKSN